MLALSGCTAVSMRALSGCTAGSMRAKAVLKLLGNRQDCASAKLSAATDDASASELSLHPGTPFDTG